VPRSAGMIGKRASSPFSSCGGLGRKDLHMADGLVSGLSSPSLAIDFREVRVCAAVIAAMRHRRRGSAS